MGELLPAPHYLSDSRRGQAEFPRDPYGCGAGMSAGGSALVRGRAQARPTRLADAMRARPRSQPEYPQLEVDLRCARTSGFVDREVCPWTRCDRASDCGHGGDVAAELPALRRWRLCVVVGSLHRRRVSFCQGIGQGGPVHLGVRGHAAFWFWACHCCSSLCGSGCGCCT
jgi:hypothetical protein